MAEGRTYSFNPQLDIRQILLEAKTRWLRPSEICEILRNYCSFHISADPPFKPAGGSLFLFDRKALRYFRKDGHRWRKKKDGKTVREAHEKLKSGSVDVLHCYYAHGEDNENFQRRSYWMLDGHLEHIVLVHYRDVIEGTNPSCSHLLNADSRSTYQMQGEKNSSMTYSGHLNSSKFAPQASNATSSYTANDLNGRTPSSEYEDPDSGDDCGGSSHVGSVSYSGSNIASGNDGEQNNAASSSGHVNAGVSMNIRGCNNSYNPLYGNRVGNQDMADCVNSHKIHGSSNLDGLFAGASYNDCTTPSAWSEILFEQEYPNLQEKTISFVKPNSSSDMIGNRTDSMLDIGGLVAYGMEERYQVLPDAQKQTCMGNNSTQAQVKDGNVEKLHASYAEKQTVGDAPHICQSPNEPHLVMTSEFETNSGSQTTSAATHNHIDSKAEASHALKSAISDMNRDEHGDLRKLDSFGRWMDKEIGPDCDESLMASDSGHYWNVLDTQSDDNEVSNLPHHMQLDMDLLGPSLSQEQLFSILDFSPGWAFSGMETKVLITGTFLGGIDPSSIKLGCMFGEDEVSAEVLVSNVIRCQAPVHASGRVPFYITCCDRLACSQIREFEYRENTIVRSLSPKSDRDDEIFFQVRLARMLLLGRDRKKIFCSIESCDKCSLINDLFLNLSDTNEWDMLVKESSAFQTYFTNPRDALIKKLLKGRLLEWLDTQVHEEGKGPNVLDEDGLGIIHLTAALGYEWAINPIIASGVNPNFRDARGRTALHWAAYFGREDSVVALVRLGAAPGAVEDPTSKFPVGQTAADLASSRGHKGIAGYLAEEDLTSHLSALDLKESVMDSVSANLAAERAIEIIQKQSAAPLEKNNEAQSTIRGSLAAVRKSAQAAARIHAAFRVQSFRRRQIMEINNGDLEITNEVMILPSLNNKVPKMTHFNDSLHTAAIKIQQKYRGYVGRRDFLKIRNRVVKIQAHFRGHRVRKQYKKVVWSVGIVEKAILRWRRKGAGLRGFRAGKPIEPVGLGTGRADEYDFLHDGRKQKFAGVEKALARVQSMARRPEARDQYMRLLASSHKSKLGDGGQYDQGLEQERESEDGLLVTMIS